MHLCVLYYSELYTASNYANQEIHIKQIKLQVIYIQDFLSKFRRVLANPVRCQYKGIFKSVKLIGQNLLATSKM